MLANYATMKIINALADLYEKRQQAKRTFKDSSDLPVPEILQRSGSPIHKVSKVNDNVFEEERRITS